MLGLTERGTSSWMVLTTDDCRATYAAPIKRDVDIIQEPTEQMYGTDMAIRDAFGNQIRIIQMASHRPISTSLTSSRSDLAQRAEPLTNLPSDG